VIDTGRRAKRDLFDYTEHGKVITIRFFMQFDFVPIIAATAEKTIKFQSENIFLDNLSQKAYKIGV
jgi:uncharacterized protein YuzE